MLRLSQSVRRTLPSFSLRGLPPQVPKPSSRQESQLVV